MPTEQSRGDLLPVTDADRQMGVYVELLIRLAALGLLLYWTFILVRPFITLMIWSAILTIALYPTFERVAAWLGGRRRLAAGLVTILVLLIVIGPVTWLALGLVDSVRLLLVHFDLAQFSFPAPPESVKAWPLIGDQAYRFWDLASTNFKAALAEIAPQLKLIGSKLLNIAASAGAGTLTFFVSIFISGFLFCPADSIARALKTFSRKLASGRGDEFIDLAGATIRSVSRGVIGISLLQSLLAGVGMVAAGIPAASIISVIVLILGIIQIGPSIVFIPLIIWSWTAMDTTTALLFSAYMIPVGLLDNIMRPIVMGRGLKTPTLVILIGVLGGIISHGITGLFLGPIVLAVVWELLSAWIDDSYGMNEKAQIQK